MKISWVALAVFLYCAWNAQDLIDLFLIRDWRFVAAIAFSIWILGGIVYGVLMRQHAAHPPYSLLVVAIGSTLLGTLGSLHIFQHIGFACAFTALLPWTPGLLIWLIGAISWMPSLEWAGSIVGLASMMSLRLTVSTLASLWLIIYARKKYER